MKKLILVLVVVLIMSPSAFAQYSQGMQDLLMLRKLQQESDPFHSAAESFSDGVAEGIEKGRREREMQEQYDRRQRENEYQRELNRQRIELERLRLERETKEAQKESNSTMNFRDITRKQREQKKRFEKQKELCRIEYEDYDEVADVALDLFENDSDYMEILNKKLEDPKFNIAEYLYKIGKLQLNKK